MIAPMNPWIERGLLLTAIACIGYGTGLGLGASLGFVVGGSSLLVLLMLGVLE